MKFKNGFYDLPTDKIATVVTSLEMRQKPDNRPVTGKPHWSLDHVEKPETNWYRDLYRAIGQDWLWYQRIMMDDNELGKILGDPLIEVRAFKVSGETKGLLELDYRIEGECELAFLGIVGDMTGRGAGKWMMAQALELAWSKPINRLWIHTCTLDHPRALPFYVRTGFKPFRRELEIAEDPRAVGKSPRDSAPQYPLIT